MPSTHSTSSTAVREVDVDALVRALESGEPVIDVREPAEYVAGHVPGAAAMPMSQLPSRLGELDRARPQNVICASGNRSAAMTEFLVQAGFNAYSVAGGTAAWARSGRRLETGAPRAV